jgi:hypothetical protein
VFRRCRCNMHHSTDTLPPRDWTVDRARHPCGRADQRSDTAPGSVAKLYPQPCRDMIVVCQATERSTVVNFKGSHFEREIVLWGVRWYVHGGHRAAPWWLKIRDRTPASRSAAAGPARPRGDHHRRTAAGHRSSGLLGRRRLRVISRLLAALIGHRGVTHSVVAALACLVRGGRGDPGGPHDPAPASGVRAVRSKPPDDRHPVNDRPTQRRGADAGRGTTIGPSVTSVGGRFYVSI